MTRAACGSHVRWNVLVLLAIVSFVAYVLKSAMSVAGPTMIVELGLSTVQLGIILGSAAWGYGMFQFPGGLLGDALGGRKATALIVLLWGAVILPIAFVPGVGVLVSVVVVGLLASLQFLLGAAQAPLFPVTSGRVIGPWFPVTGWGLPTALTSVGLTFGAAAAPPLIAWLVLRAGWRRSFVLLAPAAFICAALWYWYVRDTPGQHRGVSPDERALIDAGRENSSEPARALGGWKVVLRDRQILLLTASYFCINYVSYFFLNWGFLYLTDVRGFRMLEGGGLASLWWLSGGAGAAVGGWWCDRLTKSLGIRWGCRWPCLVGCVGCCLAMGAAGAADTPYLAVAFLCLGLAFMQFADPVYWVATMSVSGRHAAGACGVLNTGGNVVGTLNAILVPLVADRMGWVAAIGTAAGFAMIAAILWFWIEADRRPVEVAYP
jgi:MFS transporter, ACS family, glucarate transporter